MNYFHILLLGLCCFRNVAAVTIGVEQIFSIVEPAAIKLAHLVANGTVYMKQLQGMKTSSQSFNIQSEVHILPNAMNYICKGLDLVKKDFDELVQQLNEPPPSSTNGKQISIPNAQLLPYIKNYELISNNIPILIRNIKSVGSLYHSLALPELLSSSTNPSGLYMSKIMFKEFSRIVSMISNQFKNFAALLNHAVSEVEKVKATNTEGLVRIMMKTENAIVKNLVKQLNSYAANITDLTKPVQAISSETMYFNVKKSMIKFNSFLMESGKMIENCHSWFKSIAYFIKIAW